MYLLFVPDTGLSFKRMPMENTFMYAKKVIPKYMYVTFCHINLAKVKIRRLK